MLFLCGGLRPLSFVGHGPGLATISTRRHIGATRRTRRGGRVAVRRGAGFDPRLPDPAGCDLVLPVCSQVTRTTQMARYQDCGNEPFSWAYLVGDTGIEPVTSSVSATVHHFADLHRSEAIQHTALTSRSYSAVRRSRAQFRAMSCSQSAPMGTVRGSLPLGSLLPRSAASGDWDPTAYAASLLRPRSRARQFCCSPGISCSS